MPTSQSIKEIMEEGRSLEQSGSFPEAAHLYENLLQRTPANRDAIKRVLLVYRKLKDYRRELAAINNALKTMEKQDRSAQGRWLAANPQAAQAGKAMLRSLGGANVTAYGMDEFVRQLLKRKELVARKLNGNDAPKARKKAGPAEKLPFQAPKKATASRPHQGLLRSINGAGKADDDKGRPNNSPGSKGRLREENRELLRQENRVVAAKKQAARTAKIKAKRAAVNKRKAEATARKEKALKAKQNAKTKRKARQEALRIEKIRLAETRKPDVLSFFVISLQYLVALEEIDSEMSRHASFLDKYFKQRIFVVAGRQVPRTGGIILAKGLDRNTLEKIMRQDPFIKKKLATFTLVEFKGSRISQKLGGILREKTILH